MAAKKKADSAAPKADAAPKRKLEIKTPDELVVAVREHATAHYEDGGWDVVVEAYDDDQIKEVIGKAYSVKGAIARFKPLISVWADRQADAAFHAEQAG